MINTSNFKFTNDKLIRTAFRKRLENTYKDDKDVRIIDELGVIHGSARVDMAVVNGIIHGFELKSDLDTLRRLPEQMDAYNSVFDQVTLVVGKNHVHEAIRSVPEWWGVIIAKISDSNDEINFVPIREAVDNPERNPVSVARLLWRQEALDVLEKNGAGLNLTYEVRDGILGHSKGGKDLQAIDPNHMPESLEGMCVRVADRIAYLNHDIDDSVRAHVLNVDELPQDALDVLGRTHGLRIATMVMNVLHTSFGKPEVAMSGEVLHATNALKDYMYEHVYTIETRGNMELTKAQFMLKELFNLYMAKPDLIPARELVPIEDEKLSERDRLAYQVTDFIAGMTDRYATMKFKHHFFPVAWST